MKTRAPLTVLLLMACDSPTPPTAGDLQIVLATPHANDRAAQITIHCPQAPVAVRAAAAYEAYFESGGTALTLIVVRQGGQFMPAESAVATIAVPDVHQQCAPTLVGVAFQGYGLRESLAGYAVTVVRP